MFNVSIPKISDEELIKRYSQIKPVINSKRKLHYLKEYSLDELKSTSYLWDSYLDIREEVKDDELEVIGGSDFICLHKYGFFGFFKPSVAEVLAQIEDSILPQVKAFEIISWPHQICHNDSYGFSFIAYRQGYHISVVRLYRAKR